MRTYSRSLKGSYRNLVLCHYGFNLHKQLLAAPQHPLRGVQTKRTEPA